IGGTGVNRVTSDQFTVIGKIGKQATTTSLVSSLNPSTSGQAVTFRATVTPSTATGTITFFDGATALSGAVNMVGGAASFTTSALAVGTHSITARYSGSVTFLGSTSNTVSQVVNNVAAASLSAVAVSPASVTGGASAQGTVTLTSAAP